MLFELQLNDNILGECSRQVSAGGVLETRKNLFGRGDATDHGTPFQDQNLLAGFGEVCSRD
jgi:hypothetical protein